MRRSASLIELLLVTLTALAFPAPVQGQQLTCACGQTIAPADSLINLLAAPSATAFNATLFGDRDALVQRFTNPQLVTFDVITFAAASVHLRGHPISDYSWFPGYSWTVAACPVCSAHLGWKFTLRSDIHETTVLPQTDLQTFFGLIASRLNARYDTHPGAPIGSIFGPTTTTITTSSASSSSSSSFSSSLTSQQQRLTQFYSNDTTLGDIF